MLLYELDLYDMGTLLRQLLPLEHCSSVFSSYFFSTSESSSTRNNKKIKILKRR